MPTQDEMIDRARAVKAKYETELLAYPGVTGVGVGWRHKAGSFTEEVSIVVMVRKKRAPGDLNPRDILPTELDGIPVDVQESGDITVE